MIWQKIHYIHGNPVKARLVTSTKDYPWSSFRAFYDDSQREAFEGSQGVGVEDLSQARQARCKEERGQAALPNLLGCRD